MRVGAQSQSLEESEAHANRCPSEPHGRGTVGSLIPHCSAVLSINNLSYKNCRMVPDRMLCEIPILPNKPGMTGDRRCFLDTDRNSPTGSR